MNSLSLASRNIRRNHRRSLATILAIVVGAVSILLFGGFANEIHYGLRVESIRQTGHFQIQQKLYYLLGSADPTAYSIGDYKHVIESITSDEILKPLVRVVAPSLQMGGIAGNFSAGKSRTAWASAVVPEDINTLESFDERDPNAPKKTTLLTGTPEDAALIGSGMARALHICKPYKVDQCEEPEGGDVHQSKPAVPQDVQLLAESEGPSSQDSDDAASPRVAFLTATAYGAPNVAELKLAGVLVNSVKQIDDLLVAMHLTQAQKLIYGKGEPRVTALSIQLHHTNQMQAARIRLEEILRREFPKQDLVVYDFSELNPFYGQATGFLNTIFAFIAVLMGIIVAFTVSNTMGMIVAERTTEIGTLRALGVRRSGIRSLFVAEGLVFGVIGAVAGASIAVAIASTINHSGVTWTPPGRSEPTRLLIGLLDDFRLIGFTMTTLAILTAISAWWPARRAAKFEIVDALRHV